MFSFKRCRRRNSLVFVVISGCFLLFVLIQVSIYFGIKKKELDFLSVVWKRPPRPQPYISFLASVVTEDARYIEKDCMWTLQSNRTFMTKVENLLASRERYKELVEFLQDEITQCITDEPVVNTSALLNKTDIPDSGLNYDSENNLKPKPTVMLVQENNCLTDKTELASPIPMYLSDDPPTLGAIAELFPMLGIGGYYSGPRFCKARQSTAVIIPYRDREVHLRHWLHNTLGTLVKQQLEFTVFVVEQEGSDVFNKGQLMNTAFLWAQRQTRVKFQCFIFHDVDMIPEIVGNFYTCADGKAVKHLSPYIDKFNYTTNKKIGVTVGGAVAFTEWQYRAVNGYSNVYWGWGGEDDDMNLRIKLTGLRRIRPDSNYGRYKMIPHEHDGGNPMNKQRHKLLKEAKMRMARDGLGDLATQIVAVSLHPTHTHILVRLNVPHLPWLQTSSTSSLAAQTTAAVETATPISHTGKKPPPQVAKKIES